MEAGRTCSGFSGSHIIGLSGDIAILKKYLESKGVPSDAADELDRL
jgi:hypothetical protein